MATTETKVTSRSGNNRDRSWRETKKLSAKCKVEEELEKVGELTPSATTETAVGERLGKF